MDIDTMVRQIAELMAWKREVEPILAELAPRMAAIERLHSEHAADPDAEVATNAAAHPSRRVPRATNSDPGGATTHPAPGHPQHGSAEETPPPTGHR